MESFLAFLVLMLILLVPATGMIVLMVVLGRTRELARRVDGLQAEVDTLRAAMAARLADAARAAQAPAERAAGAPVARGAARPEAAARQVAVGRAGSVDVAAGAGGRPAEAAPAVAGGTRDEGDAVVRGAGSIAAQVDGVDAAGARTDVGPAARGELGEAAADAGPPSEPVERAGLLPDAVASPEAAAVAGAVADAAPQPDAAAHVEASPPAELAAAERSPADAPAEAAPHLRADRLADPPRHAPAAEPAAEAAPTGGFEELLGGTVFLRVGVATVVLALVFLLALTYGSVGAGGKLGIGLGGALAMLGAGLFAERRQGWVTFGRALIAGGWAMLYYDAFGAHFVPASAIIESPLGGVALLLLTAAAAVAFSLRYRSEWTTIAAFALIDLSLIAAVWFTDATFHLPAAAVVAVAASALAQRLGWWRLLLLASMSTWVAMGGGMAVAWSQSVPPELPLLATLLPGVVAWVAFEVALLRGEAWGASSRTAGAVAVVDWFGGLGLALALVWDRDPDLAWVPAGLFGLAWLAEAAWYRARGLRTPFVLSGVMGGGAMALVTPLRLGIEHDLVPLVRLAGLEVALTAGVLLRERWFRTLPLVALHLTALELLIFRQDAFTVGSWEVHGMWLLGAALFYADAWLLRGLWSDALEEDEVARVPWLTWTGAVLAVATVLMDLTDPQIASGLGLLALLLAAGARQGSGDLAAQAGVIGALAAWLGLLFGRPDMPYPASGATRALPAALVGLAWAAGRFDVPGLPGRALSERRSDLLAGVLATAATALAFVWMWYEPPTIFVAAVVSLAALVWTAGGLLLRLRELAALGLALVPFAALAIALFAWNLPDDGPLAHLSAGSRHAVAVILAVIPLLGAQVLWERATPLAAARPQLHSFVTHAVLAVPVVALVLLLYARLPADLLWLAPAWAALALALVATGAQLGWAAWRSAGHALLALAVTRTALYNLGDTPELARLGARLGSTLTVLGGVAGAAATTLPPARDVWRFTGVGVVVLLLLREVDPAAVSPAWAALALALVLAERLARLGWWLPAAHAVATLAFLRALAFDVVGGEAGWGVAATVVLLLAGWAAQRLTDTGEEAATLAESFQRARVGWLAAGAALLAAHLTDAADGTMLTVAWSLEGLGLVAAGFALSERPARAGGLLGLSFCVLKLFLLDLSGLQGFARVLSFLVLGIVLIAVSFAYTRFKDRLERLL